MTDLHWTAGLHHDGSALYVSNPLPRLNETVNIRLRAPKDAPIAKLFLRSAPDGEQHLEPMRRIDEDAVSAYWEASLKIVMPQNAYRFHILADDGTYYLNAMGVSRAISPDLFDFKLLADFESPSWIDSAVFYQIFPDRFYNGDPSLNVEDGAWEQSGFRVQFRKWGDPPLPWRESGNLDFYGGDLPGITQKIDYLKQLGVNAVYLNPIFMSISNHRYNIEDFFQVDKYLGGNDALIQLRQALHNAGIRLILDVTPNHTSSRHRWFTEAQKDPDAPTADFYTFYNRPDKYEAWFGVRTLPKLNYASEKLRDKMYRGEDSVLRYWLKEPYKVGGWRLDVFNMTGRQGSVQLSHKVARDMRRAIKSENPDAYLFGEHFFDGTPHLQGDEMDAVMNYMGFNMPMWRWLAGYEIGGWQKDVNIPAPMPTEAFAAQLANFRAVVPWAIIRMQFNQLDSHDTRRILNICNGDVALVKLGIALLMTYPGAPCLYYGTEIGLPGETDPDDRRCMIWDERQWNASLMTHCQRLIALRKSAPALTSGGFQQIVAEGDLWAFQRQSKEQQLLIVGYRGKEKLALYELPVRHAGVPDDATLRDLISDRNFTVENGEVNLSNLSKGNTLILEVN
jgi:alpha-glucosidase